MGKLILAILLTVAATLSAAGCADSESKKEAPRGSDTKGTDTKGTDSK